MADMKCGAVNIAVVRRSPLTDRNWRKLPVRHNDNYIHRPTAVIYMVAAGRSLVGRGASLHKLPTLDFAIAGFKIELMPDDLGQVIHSTDRAEHIGRIHDFDGTLFRLLARTANQPFEGHAVEHDVIIVNLTVGTVARGEVASFALNADNLIQHFSFSLSAGLVFFVASTLILYFSVRFKVLRPLSRL